MLANAIVFLLYFKRMNKLPLKNIILLKGYKIIHPTHMLTIYGDEISVLSSQEMQ